MPGALVLTHSSSYQHRPPEHPERPERIDAIESALDAAEFAAVTRTRLDMSPTIPGRAAEAAREAASGVHSEDYVGAVFTIGGERDAEGAGGWLDADTFIGPGSLEAATGAVLSARQAALRAIERPALTTFSFCRPPGHHATRTQAMGFCLFNNAAVAAQAALDAGLQRVAIVDFDVHHGNGTQDIFYDRQDVLYISTHQSPLYPGTGAAAERGTGEGEGFTLNLPMPAGTTDRGYLDAFDSAVLPALAAYAPDLLVVSAGFDAHTRDPLAQMDVTTEGFTLMAARLLDAARRLCSGRSAWILEGGYDLDALSASAAACVRMALQGT